MGREREWQQRVDSLGGFEEKSSRSLGGKEKKSLEESSEEGDNFWETFTGKEGVLEQGHSPFWFWEWETERKIENLSWGSLVLGKKKRWTRSVENIACKEISQVGLSYLSHYLFITFLSLFLLSFRHTICCSCVGVISWLCMDIQSCVVIAESGDYSYRCLWFVHIFVSIFKKHVSFSILNFLLVSSLALKAHWECMIWSFVHCD